jgi:hypothetical protein
MLTFLYISGKKGKTCQQHEKKMLAQICAEICVMQEQMRAAASKNMLFLHKKLSKIEMF